MQKLPIITFLLFIVVSVLTFYQFREVNNLKSQLSSLPTDEAPLAQTVTSDEVSKKELEELVAKEVADALAKLPKASPTPAPSKTATPVVTSTSKQTSYIPITGGFSTQSLSWVDVPGTDFYLDLVNDYGEEASTIWEVFIREEHGNGLAYVRLYDVTHSIGVGNSELQSNKQASTLVISQPLAIWRGKNLYRVQIKSQVGFFVYFDSGRLKITY